MELRAPRIALWAGLFGAALTLVLLAFAAPARAHVPFCKEDVNPHGQNVPPAGSTTLPGPNGGINDDGFYIVGTDVATSVTLQDTDGNVFGVFPSGTRVKYTEANGATPSVTIGAQGAFHDRRFAWKAAVEGEILPAEDESRLTANRSRSRTGALTNGDARGQRFKDLTDASRSVRCKQ
jgi:hypothetical protein